MPNYYEVLNLQPTATTSEIEVACESQYNQWRRLVTHHDPNVVNQANQALQLLETIRTTLTNTNTRAVYDAGIGIGVTLGGLADPEAILSQAAAAPTPPPPDLLKPRAGAPSAAAVSKPNLWVCPKCNCDNPADTKYCYKCGAQLVRNCPECKKMTSLVVSGFCGNCGFQYEVALQRAELTGKIDLAQQQLDTLETQLKAAESEEQKANAVAQKNQSNLIRAAIFAVISLAIIKLLTGEWLFIPRNSILFVFNGMYCLAAGVEIMLVFFVLRLITGGLRLGPSLRRRDQLRTAAYNLRQDFDTKKRELERIQKQYIDLAQQVRR
jgi:uncharacterized membrane protein YqjE